MAKQTFTTGQVLTAAQVNALQANDYNQTVSTKTASYILVAADKGTRIVMNSTSATTITVNTGLFDAGDTLYIHNTNSGVCTITAGTATVATSGSLVLAQNQGGVLYFTSASASIFFQYATPASGDIEGVTAGTGISGGGTSGTVTITNSMATEITAAGDIIVGTGSATFDNLPIGTTGQILTADTTVSPYKVKWATPAGGSGLTLIERATFTTTTSIISGSVFSATYENYLILITVNSATNAPSFEMRMRTGSTTTTTGYTFAQANANTSSSLSAYAASNTSAWDLTSGDTTNGTFIRMHMANPYASQFTHFNAQNDWTQSSTTMQVRNQAGFLNNTTSYDKFDILAQYNVTGYYAVYGFAKS